MKNALLLLTLLVSTTTFWSCNKDDDKVEEEKADYSGILVNTGENVILKTYQELAESAGELKNAVNILHENPSSETLEAAKDAWRATRSPWEQSEGFLFGPVDQEGIDPSLDSWPVNVVDLDNVLASEDELTIEFLEQQEGTLKGFHTIEFLLWGNEESVKAIEDFTDREFEYLIAATGVLANDAQKLYDLWRPENGNFISNLIDAGSGSLVYISQKSAIEEIANALVIIADEVGNGKINDPLSQKDLTLEESRFSANSKADFAHNIISIQNIYIGKFGEFGTGESLSDIVNDIDADLDLQIKAEISTAIEAIENIEGTFSDAVFNNTAQVENAQQKVRNLQATLEEKLLPLISNL